jgi:hypothetical protein
MQDDEIFMVVKIQVMVFWVMTLCSVVVEYQYFGGSCCYLHLQAEDGNSKSWYLTAMIHGVTTQKILT